MVLRIEDQIRSAQEALLEEGAESECPLHGKDLGPKRLKRSDYIRCPQCGTNWDSGDDLSLHPHRGRLPQVKLTLTPSKKR
jgi:hypothetical protein